MPDTIVPESKKIDWVAAQKYYLENGTVSYQDVADKFNTTKTSVERHASKDSWVARRHSVGEETIARVEKTLVDQNSEINDRHRGMAQSMQRLIYEKMQIAHRQIDKAKKEALKGDGLDSLTVYDTGMITESKIKSLIEAGVLAINLERVTVNLPTSVERKEITGKSGKDLFGDGDNSKFTAVLSNAAARLAERRNAKSSGTSPQGD